MRNIHDFDKDELGEIFNDAGLEFVRSGDRIGYINRLRKIGISNTEIEENLRELEIKRAEVFNSAVAQVACWAA